MKRHLLSAADLTREDAELVLRTAEELRSLAERVTVALTEVDGADEVRIGPAGGPARAAGVQA